MIYGEKAMAHLKEISRLVYLKLSYKELERRLGDLTDRGVAIRPGMTLRGLYDERVPLYEKYADITISEKDRGPGAVVDELRRIWEQQNRLDPLNPCKKTERENLRRTL